MLYLQHSAMVKHFAVLKAIGTELIAKTVNERS